MDENGVDEIKAINTDTYFYSVGSKHFTPDGTEYEIIKIEFMSPDFCEVTDYGKTRYVKDMSESDYDKWFIDRIIEEPFMGFSITTDKGFITVPFNKVTAIYYNYSTNRTGASNA